MSPGLVKFARYLFSGGTAAIVDAGGFALLLRCGMPILPAAICSFVVAAVVNFQLSSRWVFSHRPTGKLFVKFVVAALVGLTINVMATVGLAHFFGVPAALAKIGGIMTALVFNFLVNLLVVFRAPKVA